MQSASSNGPRRLRASSRPCASRYVCRTWIANTGRSRSKATTGSCWRRSPAMLTLAFDTATGVATSALVRDGEVLGERASRAARVLADAEELLQQAGAQPRELSRLVVGTGPGSFTGVRMGLAAARGLAFAPELRLAGISTLDALAAGAPRALPVVDAGRREVFTLVDGNPAVAAPGAPPVQPRPPGGV